MINTYFSHNDKSSHKMCEEPSLRPIPKSNSRSYSKNIVNIYYYPPKSIRYK